jgi:GR25 family glycosyltransferase involved in LPS biosynthesis
MDGLDKTVVTIDEARHKAFASNLLRDLSWYAEPFEGVRRSSVALGCALSHLLLWQAAAAHPQKSLMVFEDDAILVRGVESSDHEAYLDFAQDSTQGVLLLGWNPTTHRIVSSRASLAQGHALDTHAYIIKGWYAAHLLQMYQDLMKTPVHHLFGSLGAVDTIFLFETASLVVPMLFGQVEDMRYRHILRGEEATASDSGFALCKTANALWYHKGHVLLLLLAVIGLAVFSRGSRVVVADQQSV